MTDSAMEERLWAYALGQLDDAERADVERALREDPALRAELDAVTQAVRVYETLIPWVDRDVDEAMLEQRIVRGWEQTHEVADVRPVPDPETVRDVPSPAGRWFARSFGWRPVLAMAACLVVLTGIHVATLPPALEWQAPSVSVRTPRGPVPAGTAPRYSDTELRELAFALQDAVDDAHGSHPANATLGRWFRRQPDWRIQIDLHELGDGLLQLEVAAFERESDTSRETWTEYAESPEDLRSRAGAFAADVADDLSRLKHE